MKLINEYPSQLLIRFVKCLQVREAVQLSNEEAAERLGARRQAQYHQWDQRVTQQQPRLQVIDVSAAAGHHVRPSHRPLTSLTLGPPCPRARVTRDLQLLLARQVVSGSTSVGVAVLLGTRITVYSYVVRSWSSCIMLKLALYATSWAL